MLKAKVEVDEGGQIIRFPPEFKINVPEVYLKRVEEGVLMMARDPWDVFDEGVEELSDGFFEQPRVQPPLEPFRFQS
jgi:hypothetical protein